MPRMPQLEQRQLDLIGLGFVALAIFFSFVFYFGWDGGKVGEAVADGFLFLGGGVAYLVPLILFGTGAVMILRPMLPAVKPFRTGAALLVTGLMLGFAGELMGLGAQRPRRTAAFMLDPDFLRVHGGIFGEALNWASQTLIQDVGTAILFAFLLITGILMLTGASLAGLVRSTRDGIATTTQRVRTSTGEFASVITGRSGRLLPAPEPAAGDPAALFDPTAPPEVEPVVHATHVEIPVGETGEEDELRAGVRADRGGGDRGLRRAGRRSGANRAARRARRGRAHQRDSDGQPPLDGDGGRWHGLQAAARQSSEEVARRAEDRPQRRRTARRRADRGPEPLRRGRQGRSRPPPVPT